MNDLQERQKKLDPTSALWSSLQLQIAEVTRRRSRNSALVDAAREIERVKPERLEDIREEARLWYEWGYIDLLSGNLSTSFAHFEIGRKVLEAQLQEVGNKWRWAAHTALMAQVARLSFAAGFGGWTWADIRKELHQALLFAQRDVADLNACGDTEQAGQPNEMRHAQRWVHNGWLHLMKPELAEGRTAEASECWREAYTNWQKMDVSSGWDIGFRTTHLLLFGKFLLAKGDSVRALNHLVRTLPLLLGLRRQQPEGIRDILFGIADGLASLQDTTRESIQEVAKACMDYSSWFNPSIVAEDQNRPLYAVR